MSFSALQRAENSSTATFSPSSAPYARYQCSSASRKFLNHSDRGEGNWSAEVSVLFSEPKIPQRLPLQPCVQSDYVSVLFSEPKIPQRSYSSQTLYDACSFSALQRAENSSTRHRLCECRHLVRFSALQRAENSSTPTLAPASIHISDRDDHASSFLSLPGASP